MNAIPGNMAGALPDIERVREAQANLAEAGVRYVLSCWIDMLGVPKTKPVPLGDFENLCMGKGPQFAVHLVSFVPELTPADSDQIQVPDLDTLVICPWDRACAWMFADLWWEDAPYNLCPRQALKRVVSDAAAKGFAGFAGIEPEFIVMRWRDGQPVKAFDDDPLPGDGVRPRRQAFGYDVEFSIDSMGFLGALIDIIEELGWGLKDVVAGGAYSQFELDFGYTDVLRMADRLVFLRVLLKEVAKKHGMFVTFMPKPTIGDWRSGAHINYSMQRTDAPGVNLFDDAGTADWSRCGVRRGRRAAAPRRCAHRHRLLDRQLLQRSGAPGRGVRGRHRDLGTHPHDLWQQQPFVHAAPAPEPVLHREPCGRHVHESVPVARHDHRGDGRRGGGGHRSRTAR